MPITHSHEFVRKLTKVLGIPKYATGFSLDVRLEKMVTVTVTYMPDPDSADAQEITETFELVPKQE